VAEKWLAGLGLGLGLTPTLRLALGLTCSRDRRNRRAAVAVAVGETTVVAAAVGAVVVAVGASVAVGAAVAVGAEEVSSTGGAEHTMSCTSVRNGIRSAGHEKKHFSEVMTAHASVYCADCSQIHSNTPPRTQLLSFHLFMRSEWSAVSEDQLS